MTPRRLTLLCTGMGTVWILCAAFATYAQQPAKAKPKSPAVSQEVDAKHRVSVTIARERATVMHEIYESTLHAMHRHYFRNGRATLPARALEDVFSEMADQTKVDAHWIAVNTKAMSIDHEPDTEFEKSAAKEIATGKDELELIEDGYYRRATAIPLGAGCVSCHNGLLAPPPKSPRYAGLVISIPIHED